MSDIYDQHYDHDRGKEYYSNICDTIMEGLHLNGNLLDIGCGTGLFMRRYLQSGGEVCGLDLSHGMLTRARVRCAGHDVTVGDAEVLPFKANSFDAVASLLAFSYLRHPEDMLRESYRVLKPGGVLSICTLGKNIFTLMVPIIYRLGEKMHIKRVGMASFSEHYYNNTEIRELFENNGFTGVKVKRKSFAHVNFGDSLFDATKKIEPFVEEKIPKLAYNICVSGTKPDNLK